MANVKELVVKLIADASGYDKGTKKAVEDNEKLKKSSGGLKDGFLKGAGAALGFIGTAVGISTVGDAIGMVKDYMTEAVQSAMDMQTAQAETNRILASGNHVMGLTGAAVDDISQRMMAQTGVDDDVVRGAENILAGYNNISLKAFPGVTAAALDMARAQQQATGQQFDAAAASRALGMALQDPAKGARLLRQYNIVLSQSQQDAINTAMKHGDVQKAQGVIMDAVTAKVNGASAAYKNTAAGGMMAFQTALGNIQKAIGGAFLPVLTKILTIVVPIATQFAQQLPAALDAVGQSIGPIVKGFGDLIGNLLKNKPLMDGIKNAFKELQPLIGPVVAVLAVLTAISFAPLAILIGVIAGIALGLKKLWEVTEPVRTVLGNFLGVLGNLKDLLITGVQHAITAVVDKVQAFWKATEPLRTAIGNLIAKAIELRQKALEALQPAIDNVNSKLAELHTWFSEKVLPVIMAVHAFFQDKILPVLEKVGGFIKDQVVAQLQRMWGFIQANVLPVLGQLGGFIKDQVMANLQRMWSLVQGSVLPMLGNLAGALKNGVGREFQIFGDVINTVFGKAGDFLGMLGRLRDSLGQLKDKFAGLHLEFPKIKMPHFSITGSFNLNPPSVPHLDIQWYKTGGIFNGPQVIGVGEAGPEAVIPLDRLSSAGGGNGGGSSNGQPVNIQLDGRTIVRAFLPYLVEELRRSGAIRSI